MKAYFQIFLSLSVISAILMLAACGPAPNPKLSPAGGIGTSVPPGSDVTTVACAGTAASAMMTIPVTSDAVLTCCLEAILGRTNAKEQVLNLRESPKRSEIRR